MKYFRLLILSMAFILTFAHICSAHGVSGSIVEKTGFLVMVEYDDGEPMAYASMEIHNLKEKLPFQSGWTDKNGRFMFLPDAPGEWQVVVSDGMGHQVALNASVTENMVMSREMDQNDGISHGRSFSRYENALMGISVIFNIFGFLFWWKGRKNNRGH